MKKRLVLLLALLAVLAIGISAVAAAEGECPDHEGGHKYDRGGYIGLEEEGKHAAGFLCSCGGDYFYPPVPSWIYPCSIGSTYDQNWNLVCYNCHSATSGFHSQTVDYEQYSFVYRDEERHYVAANCITCGVIYYEDLFMSIPVSDQEDGKHVYKEDWHEGEICWKCKSDENGVHDWENGVCTLCTRLENEQQPTIPDDPEIPEEPACAHRTLINRYFTWVSATQHHESSECKDCGEVFESTGSHGTSATWHNGTVCVYCRTDENGKVHNWYSGACTACGEGKPAPEPEPTPDPIPDGLNPDDGWYYVDGEKSDFTGLCEYDTGLFYIENGQWQRDLNGLKLIGEDFWFLANGQVQKHHGFALYDGEWFYLDGGKLDVTASGVYNYNGKTFLVAAGRLVGEYSGLAQVPSGEWYYVAEGRVLTEFSGEIEWNGTTFQIVNGKLAA